MVKSAKPKKQRKFRKKAPLHIRKKFLKVHISKALKQKLDTKKRTIVVKKGDKVKVKVGKHKGKDGKVLNINYKNIIINIEGLTRLNARGNEKFIPIRPSNVELIDMKMDKDREKILKR